MNEKWKLAEKSKNIPIMREVERQGEQMAEKTKKPGLEENFARLEAVIEQLEAEDISLEEAFSAYSAGMKLLKECNEQIDKVEKKVLKLSEQGVLEEL